MKNLIIAICLVFTICISTSAQLALDSVGNVSAKNMSLYGVAGMSGSGVLNVSTEIEEYTEDGVPSILIRTESNDCAYPIIHYKYGNPLFFVNNEGYVYSGSYVTYSDSINKTEIATIDSPLSKLKQLRGVSYKFKNEINEPSLVIAQSQEIREQMANEHKRKRVGLIAQEVEKVFPEVVRTQFNGKKELCIPILLVFYTDVPRIFDNVICR